MHNFTTIPLIIPNFFKAKSYADETCISPSNPLPPQKQSMVWNGMENGMEWNGNFCMEYERCQNEMEWKISERNGRQSSILP